MFTTDPHNKPQIIKRSELIIVNLNMKITIATIVIILTIFHFLTCQVVSVCYRTVQ